MKIPAVARQQANRGQGDAVVHFCASALATIVITLPDEPEQTTIAEVLSDMDADLAALDAQAAKARAVKAEVGEQIRTVRLIDWANPAANHFAIADEVAMKAATSDGKTSGKRPDVVIHVDGIALGVPELKRAPVSVSEGIRETCAMRCGISA